jgi:hypothetical protein
MSDESPVFELRLALTVEDYDRAFAFWHEALGLPVSHAFGEGDARGVVLNAGRATVEILSTAQARSIGSKSASTEHPCGSPSGRRSAVAAEKPEQLAPGGSDIVETPHRNIRLKVRLAQLTPSPSSTAPLSGHDRTTPAREGERSLSDREPWRPRPFVTSPIRHGDAGAARGRFERLRRRARSRRGSRSRRRRSGRFRGRRTAATKRIAVDDNGTRMLDDAADIRYFADVAEISDEAIGTSRAALAWRTAAAKPAAAADGGSGRSDGRRQRDRPISARPRQSHGEAERGVADRPLTRRGDRWAGTCDAPSRRAAVGRSR